MAFTVITALPTPPQSTDTQAVFEARADAEIAALNPFITQTNTLALEFNNFSKALGLSLIGKSLTSQNIALGLLNFTVEQNLGYALGNYLKIAAAIAPSNNMYGTVTAYSITTGAISVSIELKSGTGTFSDWVFSLSAPANGAIGGTEFVVATGTASAYIINPINSISIYKEGMAWDVKFPVACIDSPVASISGLANTNIVVLTTDGTWQNAAARDIIKDSLSTLQLADTGGGVQKLWLKDPAVEHSNLSVITADTALTIANSLGKVIKSGGGASRIITLPVFSTFPLEGVIEIISENSNSLQLVRQVASDVIDFYGTNPVTSPVTGAFLDVPYKTVLRIIRNNSSWQITNFSGSAATSKIQSISASVTANALTLTYNGGSLDFRNGSLINGTQISYTVPTNFILVPSGATLGMLSAIQGRLILIEAYNGGAPVACVVNLAGGVQLDETNLISPTIISAAANSSSVIYSASAVSANSPYRVVGFVDITETTAGTWATDATLKQGIGGQALAALSSLGYGQTWQDVTASRVAATTYYNATGKPIFVSIAASNATSTILLTVGGILMNRFTNGTANVVGSVAAVIPPGASYSINASTITLWAELR